MLKRLINFHLLEWKNRKSRKPLLLRGARQTGKTHAIRQLGAHFDTFIELNFELIKDAKKLFEKDLKPKRLLQEILGLMGMSKIEPTKTLIFFDEIQAVPEAITALRYFYELMPELPIIAAGSLLDFAIEKVGVPVGRVSNMYLYPLSFLEFLAATNHASLIPLAMEEEALSPPLHDQLMELLGVYFAVGGMPEAVAKWVATEDTKEVFQVHHDLLASYRQDFDKYAKKSQLPYLEVLFRQLPSLVGEQFHYKNIHGEYRKRELAPCLDLLCKARVVHRVQHSASHGVPLGAEINMEWFKIIFVDIALTQAALGFDLSTWLGSPGTEHVNRGAIAEAFVGQELLVYASPKREESLYFWKRESKSSQAEVDYVREDQRTAIPIEVKSGTQGSLQSMRLFLEEHPKSPHGILFYANPASRLEKVSVRPLYGVASLVHEDQKLAIQALL